MRVRCEVEDAELENDSGRSVDGTRVICGKCGHVAESFGTHEGSVKRCLVLLREECPEGQANFYVADE